MRPSCYRTVVLHLLPSFGASGVFCAPGATTRQTQAGLDVPGHSSRATLFNKMPQSGTRFSRGTSCLDSVHSFHNRESTTLIPVRTVNHHGREGYQTSKTKYESLFPQVMAHAISPSCSVDERGHHNGLQLQHMRKRSACQFYRSSRACTTEHTRTAFAIPAHW
jgi:hypothetical protein